MSYYLLPLIPWIEQGGSTYSSCCITLWSVWWHHFIVSNTLASICSSLSILVRITFALTEDRPLGIGLIISTLDCYSAFGLPTTFEVEKGKFLFNNGCYLIGRLECLLRNIIFAMKRPWLDQQCSVLTKIFYHFKKLLFTNSKYFKLSSKGSKVVLGLY